MLVKAQSEEMDRYKLKLKAGPDFYEELIKNMVDSELVQFFNLKKLKQEKSENQDNDDQNILDNLDLEDLFDEDELLKTR